MRPFIIAGFAAIIIAIGAAAALDRFVQESASAAFTAPNTRL
jgi:hypothetical protein